MHIVSHCIGSFFASVGFCLRENDSDSTGANGTGDLFFYNADFFPFIFFLHIFSFLYFLSLVSFLFFILFFLWVWSVFVRLFFSLFPFFWFWLVGWLGCVLCEFGVFAFTIF